MCCPEISAHLHPAATGMARRGWGSAPVLRGIVAQLSRHSMVQYSQLLPPHPSRKGRATTSRPPLFTAGLAARAVQAPYPELDLQAPGASYAPERHWCGRARRQCVHPALTDPMQHRKTTASPPAHQPTRQMRTAWLYCGAVPAHALVRGSDGREGVQAQLQVPGAAGEVVQDGHLVAAGGEVEGGGPAAVAVAACTRVWRAIALKAPALRRGKGRTALQQ
jgi:hypothetical protein